MADVLRMWCAIALGDRSAFYRASEPGSRIEIPVDIIRVARRDTPIVRTVEGTVFLTLSDADMIESKILACLARSILKVRDVLDIFLSRDALRPDSPCRLSQKLSKLAFPAPEVIERLNKLARNRTVHVRGIERLLAEQVQPAVTGNLRTAGGPEMIWDSVMHLLGEILGKREELSS